MSIGLDYKDTISLIDPVIDSYGGEKIGQVEEVYGLFIQRTAQTQANNRSEITSDAEVYIDPTHWFVIENVYRLEEMLVIASPFSSDAAIVADAWYRVEDVVVGQDKLLGNQIDNVKLVLKKTVPIGYVS